MSSTPPARPRSSRRSGPGRFDAALRDPAAGLALDGRYDSGDHLHPSEAGQAQLGRTAVTALHDRLPPTEPAASVPARKATAVPTVAELAARDRDVVAGFYGAMTRAEHNGGFSPEDLTRVQDFSTHEREPDRPADQRHHARLTALSHRRARRLCSTADAAKMPQGL
ncbi:hypothetical protein [Kineosporia babensis]|uniref:SGNH hydrolase-type esterase domain-containing protein n=1 Tax=Kineosporia babensis TaxID=499548 RepID=A0A9X1T3N9_9ACTN|nr:hypothetical protein [Kineosporia babensis]MCD5315898.1 hypothetical protein [Kineosporia babensis]